MLPIASSFDSASAELLHLKETKDDLLHKIFIESTQTCFLDCSDNQPFYRRTHLEILSTCVKAIGTKEIAAQRLIRNTLNDLCSVIDLKRDPSFASLIGKVYLEASFVHDTVVLNFERYIYDTSSQEIYPSGFQMSRRIIQKTFHFGYQISDEIRDTHLIGAFGDNKRIWLMTQDSQLPFQVEYFQYT